MVRGQSRPACAGPYLQAYSREMAWREDNRRVSNGQQYLMAAEAALRHGVSRQWRGTGSGQRTDGSHSFSERFQNNPQEGGLGARLVFGVC